MKVAIAVFNNRVTPRFDCAPEYIIASVPAGEDSQPQRFAFEAVSESGRIDEILRSGAKVLICGGISPSGTQKLAENGMQVYSWVSGAASHALTLLEAGELTPAAIIGPRGRCCGRWGTHPGSACGLGRGSGGGRGRGMGGGRGCADNVPPRNQQ